MYVCERRFRVYVGLCILIELCAVVSVSGGAPVNFGRQRRPSEQKTLLRWTSQTNILMNLKVY